jgi:hypothetical protein
MPLLLHNRAHLIVHGQGFKLLHAGSVERPRSGLFAPAVPRPIRRLCKVPLDTGAVDQRCSGRTKKRRRESGFP